MVTVLKPLNELKDITQEHSATTLQDKSMGVHLSVSATRIWVW